jgi:hypothetical protein
VHTISHCDFVYLMEFIHFLRIQASVIFAFLSLNVGLIKKL